MPFQKPPLQSLIGRPNTGKCVLDWGVFLFFLLSRLSLLKFGGDLALAPPLAPTLALAAGFCYCSCSFAHAHEP